MEWPEAKLARLVKVLGAISQDGLAISGVPIAEITRRVSTPCYVYSGEAIIAQIQRVASMLGPETSLYYSLKANPSLGVCQLIARQGIGAEVASIGELLLAQRAGFPASRTLFAGPGKTEAELGAAVSLGIQAINVESLGEIERLADIASAAGKRAALGLRVNPLKHVKGAYMRMGGGPQQFGIDEEQLPEAIRLAKKSAWLHVVGIHVYGGTQIFDVDGLLAHCAQVVETASDVATQLGQPLEFIDFGGGFGVPYFEDLPELDLDAFAEGYRGVVQSCRKHTMLERVRPVIELGRYLVAEAGIYATRVVDIKHSRGKTFVVTDGGMNHHITATGNFGQVLRKAYPIAVLDRWGSRVEERKTIVGPCCTPLDTLAQNLPFPHVSPGDVIGVFMSGAYGYSASSLAFLSHPTPAEVLVYGGKMHTLREAGKPDDVLANQNPLW